MNRPLHPTACNHSYLAGVEARKKRIHKNNCPYAWATQLWAWWLAGWNDEDIANAQKGKQ